MYFWCIYVKREKGFEVCNKKCIFLRFNLFFYLKKIICFERRSRKERRIGNGGAEDGDQVFGFYRFKRKITELSFDLEQTLVCFYNGGGAHVLVRLVMQD